MKWVDDIPYEAPAMEDKARRKWMLGTVMFMITAVLGILGWLLDLGDHPATLLSNRMGVGSIAVWGLILLLHLFRLGCYAAWRRGKAIKWVYRCGQAAALALILPVGAWTLSGIFKEDPPKSPFLNSYSYQSSPLAAFAWGDGRGQEGEVYQYQIVNVKAPCVYDLCLDTYTRERISLYSSNWEPWPAVLGAEALYEGEEGRNWLALWTDRIVWVSFEKAPADDGTALMTVLKRLNAWER